MNVILLQDVAKIGRRFDEVTVPDGYAFNMLIPKGMAQVASPENKKKLQALKSKQAADVSLSTEALASTVAALNKTPLTVTIDANDQGHMFEALKASVVAEAAAVAGHTIAADQITFSEPIKAVGEHKITLSAGAESATITITIVAA